MLTVQTLGRGCDSQDFSIILWPVLEGGSNVISSNQSSSHNVNGECLVSNLKVQLVLGSQQCYVVSLPLAVCLLVGFLRCEIVHGTVLTGVRSFSFLPPVLSQVALSSALWFPFLFHVSFIIHFSFRKEGTIWGDA